MYKKVLIFVFFTVIFITATIGFIYKIPIQADSGWDTDYSSGGGGYSGSSYSRSYDYSRSRDYSSSSSHESSNVEILGVILILSYFISIAIILFLSLKFIKTLYYSIESNIYTFLFLLAFSAPIAQLLICYYKNIMPDLKQPIIFILVYLSSIVITRLLFKYIYILNRKKINNKIVNLLPTYDLEKLEKELYKDFVDIQFAWRDFDCNKLEKLCTNELYESYKSDLTILKSKQQQNIMNGFDKKHLNIKNVVEKNNKIIVHVELSVSFYDYVINTSDKKVVRGKKGHKVTNTYKLKYIKSINEKEKCPNCGADVNSNICEFCNTHINNIYKSFVLSEKRRK